MTLVVLLSGFVLLIGGADLLVRGASRLALRFGIPPLVVGLTVVAYGTSAPEMAVSIGAALSGQADLAVGNVVGSNVFNVLLILGVSALIIPLVVQQQLVRVDVPLMIGLSGLVAWMARDGAIDRLEGLLLATGAVLYTGFLVAQGRRARSEPPPDSATTGPDGVPRLGLYMLAGIVLLLVGSRLLVLGAVAVARSLQVSELVIGLTVVAAGTSLPEAATSVVAALRGARDLAVGNVVGSNIFNLLAVLGVTAALAPTGVPVAAGAQRFDIPVMVVAAVACLPVFFTDHRISRWEGGLFLAYYVAYVGYVVLAGSHSSAAPLLGHAMLWFVIPLTAATLALLAFRALRRRPGTRP